MAQAKQSESTNPSEPNPDCPLFINGKCRIGLPAKYIKGSSALPLHIKMGWDWNSDLDLMYHLTFEGHLYCASKAILAIAVGYLYLQNGLTNDGVSHITEAVKVTTYKSRGDGGLARILFKYNIVGGRQSLAPNSNENH
eukprot:869705_1